MAISRAQLLKELEPGLNKLFGLEYATYENEHKDLYEVENSDRAFEEEQKLSGFGAAPVKPEGGSISYDTAQESFTARWTHETIAMGFSITEEAMEDNLYDSLSARYTKALARSMAYTKQVKAAALYNNGFTTYNSGDGVSLFNAAHPTVSGAVNANTFAVQSDLNETSLEQASIDIAAYVDERGLMVSARPRCLIVPPALMHTATRLLETEKRVGTADNDVSSIVTNGTYPDGYKVNHYFTDPDAWFIKTDIPNGMKMFNRVSINTKMEGDFDTGNVRYKARERYSFGVADPLAVFGSSGS